MTWPEMIACSKPSCKNRKPTTYRGARKPMRASAPFPLRNYADGIPQTTRLFAELSAELDAGFGGE